MPFDDGHLYFQTRPLVPSALHIASCLAWREPRKVYLQRSFDHISSAHLGAVTITLTHYREPAVHLPLALLYMYYHCLKRRPLPSMLLNIRSCVDSNPIAPTILTFVFSRFLTVEGAWGSK